MERINEDGDPVGEFTDSEIPGETDPEHGRHASTERPGEFTDSDIPGEPEHHGALETGAGEYTESDIPGEKKPVSANENEYQDKDLP